MSHKLFTDARLFSLIDRFDADAVAFAHDEGCLNCCQPLDRADYERKPRSVGGGLGDGPRRRPSLCCRKDGCRRRKTPPQLLFLGRHAYVSVVVILVAAMCQGPTPSRLGAIERALGVSLRTMLRVQDDVYKEIKELSEQGGLPMSHVIAKAIEEYKRVLFFDDLDAAFTRLKADPVAWQDEKAERAESNGTLMDGLKDD